jgi:hypothetical protein
MVVLPKELPPLKPLGLAMVDVADKDLFALFNLPVGYHELLFPRKLDEGIRVTAMIDEITGKE